MSSSSEKPVDSRSVTGQFESVAVKNSAPSQGKKPSPPPFSLRLTKTERERLERDAGRKSLGAYIRAKVFGEAVSPRRERRKPRPDDEAIARALGVLGRSHLASNLNQIAKAANAGTLPIGSDLTQELHTACADIRTMRIALIEALGIKAE